MKTAKSMVRDILDLGLADSTWREQHPQAYTDLLSYREYLEASIDEATLKIMIVVPHYWGKADTITDAWQQVKKSSHGNLRRLKSGPWRVFAVWDTDKVKTYINDIGSLCYPSGHHYIKIDENKSPR